MSQHNQLRLFSTGEVHLLLVKQLLQRIDVLSMPLVDVGLAGIANLGKRQWRSKHSQKWRLVQGQQKKEPPISVCNASGNGVLIQPKPGSFETVVAGVQVRLPESVNRM
eukprot:Platyproteum_vivax@DN6469_c0_g1_i3.p2